MVANIVANTLGIFFLLYFFWKKLKEDYASTIIFTTAVYALLGVLVGYLISLEFFSQWWFFWETLFLFVGLVVGVLRFKLRIFEILEAATVSFLPWLSFIFLKDSISNQSLISLVAFVFLLLLLFLFFFLDKHYKRFTWYKSGKIGFSGMTTLGVFFLIRAVVGAFNLPMISFVGKLDSVLSAVISFIAFLMVYNLSRSTN